MKKQSRLKDPESGVLFYFQNGLTDFFAMLYLKSSLIVVNPLI